MNYTDLSNNRTTRDVNDTLYISTAAAVVPLPSGAWMGLALLGGTGGFGFVRRRIRAH